MARKTKQEKQWEREAEAAFKKHNAGFVFDIFDLHKISDAGIDAGRAGEIIDDAVKAACSKFAL